MFALRKNILRWSITMIQFFGVSSCFVWLVYKALNGTVPYYISGLLKYNTSQQKLRSSSQHLLVTPKAILKTYGERAFAVAALRLWNSIPLELRFSSLINIFKRHLKTYLVKHAFFFNSFKFFPFPFLVF